MNKTPYRASRQRNALYEFLCSTKAHPTAQEIYEVMRPDFPNLSFGTVYRNLGILEDQGLVRRLGRGSTFDRFDAAVQAHYHFVCDRCLRIYDLPLPVDSALEAKVEELTGHSVREHELDFHGICASCKEKSANPGGSKA
jgi:Fur family transcriptional regulator, peroxide stress response regulator